MKLLIVTLAPLTSNLHHATLPVRVSKDFRAARHEPYLAAPVGDQAHAVRAATGAAALLPLHPAAATAWTMLALNIARVVYWARRWRPDLYLADGIQAATMTHLARGATGGHGLSVLYLTHLLDERSSRTGALLERRAIQECDRLVTTDASLTTRLIQAYSARGGDLALLPTASPETLVSTCESFLAEPPGFG
jgi:hypothetical protein